MRIHRPIWFGTICFCIALVFCTPSFSQKRIGDNADRDQDRKALSKLNAQFIRNFINQDTVAHSKIIHPDFVCIEGSGQIVGRKEYMKDWVRGYEQSGYTTFTYTDELIRIFGNMALVRSKTVFKRLKNGTVNEGNSIYTDTYVKEKGNWLCVQAHITPVSK